MYLNKYTNVRAIGKGGFGDVFLVKDENGVEYALKILQLDKFKDEYMREYLEGEIKCMQSVHSPYIVQLIEKSEDEENIYLILQYCEKGDLTQLQGKMPKKIFSVEKATQILADVIKGLEDLHFEGYLHRDIKSANVLIKHQNGKDVYKLADFGFSKKATDVAGTVLGTDQFMSPEIFKNQAYGFEVDMWAFGVLFYFLLHMQYPFKLNSNLESEDKEIQLIKQASGFNYRRFVEKSKRKFLENVTPELEDLFLRIFNVNAKKRITFAQIRFHPVFAKHFPQISAKSKIYGKEFKGKMPNTLKRSNSQELDGDIRTSVFLKRGKDKKFIVEQEIVQKMKDQIDFLRDNAQQFLETDVFSQPQKIMVCYNIQKYYIILLRNLKLQWNVKNLAQKYPDLKWIEFSGTIKFKELMNQSEQDLLKAQTLFNRLHDSCENNIEKILQINPKFNSAFSEEIKQTSFQGAFRDSYRRSTVFIFGVLRQMLKTSKKGNKLNYLLSMLVISHAFNNIFADIQNLRIILAQFLSDKKTTVQKISYVELREWMSKSDREVLNTIAKKIIKIYFQ